MERFSSIFGESTKPKGAAKSDDGSESAGDREKPLRGSLPSGASHAPLSVAEQAAQAKANGLPGTRQVSRPGRHAEDSHGAPPPHVVVPPTRQGPQVVPPPRQLSSGSPGPPGAGPPLGWHGPQLSRPAVTGGFASQLAQLGQVLSPSGTPPPRAYGGGGPGHGPRGAVVVPPPHRAPFPPMASGQMVRPPGVVDLHRPPPKQMNPGGPPPGLLVAGPGPGVRPSQMAGGWARPGGPPPGRAPGPPRRPPNGSPSQSRPPPVGLTAL